MDLLDSAPSQTLAHWHLSSMSRGKGNNDPKETPAVVAAASGCSSCHFGTTASLGATKYRIGPRVLLNFHRLQEGVSNNNIFN